MKHIFNFLTAAAALFFIVLVFLAAPSFFAPEFEIVNNSSETVSVTAAWRSQERQIGSIKSMSSQRFSVNDEAAMKFRVRYASGKVVETEPLYFSSGIKLIATIAIDNIDVRYDHQP